MPRPPFKRSKLNLPTPSKRVANASKISIVEELQQKLAHKPVGRILTDSDDSDKLVTTRRTGRNRGGTLRKDIYASGGVGLGDVPGAHKSQKKQLQGSQRANTQNAAGKKEVHPATQQGNVGRVAKPAANEGRGVGERHKPSPSAPGLTAPSLAPTRLQSTPALEHSILGTIKPRRRQPSILQLLGNNDSSNIEDENEDDFLPNDESTPLDHPTTHAPTSNPNSPLSNLSPSRKRKLTPPATLVPASQERESSPPGPSRVSDAANKPCSEPGLPPPRQPSKAPLRITPEPDDPSIMAPPLSSSPLKSPAKPAIPSAVNKAPSKGAKKPLAPTTSELRALMPSRRQLKSRLRTKAVSEFDIPADSTPDDSDKAASPQLDTDEDPSFRADTNSRRSNAATKKKALAKPVPKKVVNARMRGKEKPSTINPAKLTVTPLKRRPTAQKSKSAAKSSSLLQPPTTSKGKSTYSLRRHDISGDKENRPVDLSGGFSGREEEGLEGLKGLEGNDDLFIEQSIEEGESEIATATAVTRETEMMAKKFADVDEWEMEFEDVSLGGNSSPDRR